MKFAELMFSNISFLTIQTHTNPRSHGKQTIGTVVNSVTLLLTIALDIQE